MAVVYSADFLTGMDGWAFGTGTGGFHHSTNEGIYWYCSSVEVGTVYFDLTGLVPGDTYTFAATIKNDYGEGYSIGIDDADGPLNDVPSAPTEYRVSFEAVASTHRLQAKVYSWGGGYLSEVRVETGVLPDSPTVYPAGGGGTDPDPDPEPEPTLFSGWGIPL